MSKSSCDDVVKSWQKICDTEPEFTFLRPPETGLVMTRGRVGGTGNPFNLGEMTVTRCSVRLDNGTIGHGYVSGRDKRHAELCAVIDAVMQGDAEQRLDDALITPLERQLSEKKAQHAHKAAATKVEFFTMSRTSQPK